MYKFKIGDIVKHKNGNWTATVKSRKFDYAYGLGARSHNKIALYTLEYEGKELMGLWGEPELKQP